MNLEDLEYTEEQLADLLPKSNLLDPLAYASIFELVYYFPDYKLSRVWDEHLDKVISCTNFVLDAACLEYKTYLRGFPRLGGSFELLRILLRFPLELYPYENSHVLAEKTAKLQALVEENRTNPILNHLLAFCLFLSNDPSRCSQVANLAYNAYSEGCVNSGLLYAASAVLVRCDSFLQGRSSDVFSIVESTFCAFSKHFPAIAGDQIQCIHDHVVSDLKRQKGIDRLLALTTKQKISVLIALNDKHFSLQRMLQEHDHQMLVDVLCCGPYSLHIIERASHESLVGTLGSPRHYAYLRAMSSINPDYYSIARVNVLSRNVAEVLLITEVDLQSTVAILQTVLSSRYALFFVRDYKLKQLVSDLAPYFVLDKYPRFKLSSYHKKLTLFSFLLSLPSDYFYSLMSTYQKFKHYVPRINLMAFLLYWKKGVLDFLSDNADTLRQSRGFDIKIFSLLSSEEIRDFVGDICHDAQPFFDLEGRRNKAIFAGEKQFVEAYRNRYWQQAVRGFQSPSISQTQLLRFLEPASKHRQGTPIVPRTAFMSSETSPIQRLPKVLLLVIMRFLLPRDALYEPLAYRDVIHFSMVNKFYYTLLQNEYFWRDHVLKPLLYRNGLFVGCTKGKNFSESPVVSRPNFIQGMLDAEYWHEGEGGYVDLIENLPRSKHKHFAEMILQQRIDSISIALFIPNLNETNANFLKHRLVTFRTRLLNSHIEGANVVVEYYLAMANYFLFILDDSFQDLISKVIEHCQKAINLGCLSAYFILYSMYASVPDVYSAEIDSVKSRLVAQLSVLLGTENALFLDYIRGIILSNRQLPHAFIINPIKFTAIYSLYIDVTNKTPDSMNTREFNLLSSLVDHNHAEFIVRELHDQIDQPVYLGGLMQVIRLSSFVSVIDIDEYDFRRLLQFLYLCYQRDKEGFLKNQWIKKFVESKHLSFFVRKIELNEVYTLFDEQMLGRNGKAYFCSDGAPIDDFLQFVVGASEADIRHFAQLSLQFKACFGYSNLYPFWLWYSKGMFALMNDHTAIEKIKMLGAEVISLLSVSTLESILNDDVTSIKALVELQLSMQDHYTTASLLQALQTHRISMASSFSRRAVASLSDPKRQFITDFRCFNGWTQHEKDLFFGLRKRTGGTVGIKLAALKRVLSINILKNLQLSLSHLRNIGKDEMLISTLTEGEFRIIPDNLQCLFSHISPTSMSVLVRSSRNGLSYLEFMITQLDCQDLEYILSECGNEVPYIVSYLDDIVLPSALARDDLSAEPGSYVGQLETEKPLKRAKIEPQEISTRSLF